MTDKQWAELKRLSNVIINDCPTEPAITYARAVFTIPQTHAYAFAQLGYIMANLQYWKGDLARTCKQRLRTLYEEMK